MMRDELDLGRDISRLKGNLYLEGLLAGEYEAGRLWVVRTCIPARVYSSGQVSTTTLGGLESNFHSSTSGSSTENNDQLVGWI